SKWSDPGVWVQAAEIATIEQQFVSRLTARIDTAIARNTTSTPIDPALVDTVLEITAQLPAALLFDSLRAPSEIPAGFIGEWTISAHVRNGGSAPLLLNEPDPSDVLFSRPGYAVEAPNLSFEERLLASGKERALIYTVTTTSSRTGETQVRVRIGAADLNDPDADRLTAERTTQILVETNAAVRLVSTAIDPERFHVMPGDTAAVNLRQLFQIGVVVQNEGGQRLDSVWVRLEGEQSRIFHPDTAVTNLDYGEKRTIWFDVQADSVENLVSGETFQSAILRARGLDGSPAKINSADDSTAAVKIYTPAEVKIVETRVVSPQPNLVSWGQAFPVQVRLTNLQSEWARDVRIKLSASPDTLLIFPDSLRTLQPWLGKGDTLQVDFTLTAAERSGQVDLFAQVDQARGANSGQAAAIMEARGKDSTFVEIQQGAQLQVLSVGTSLAPAEISAGDSRNPWQVIVRVQNTGTADLQLVGISAENMRFVTDGTIDPDYDIRPPLKLRQASAEQPFVLPGQGKIDTLVYVVSENGKIAGTSTVRIDLRAIDRNRGLDSPVQTGTGQTQVFVKNRAWVRIRDVSLTTPVVSPDGSNHVNRGQDVRLIVALETGELAGVDDVSYELRSDGNSLGVAQMVRTFANIANETTARDTIDFNADASWPLAQGVKLERLTARVLSAKAEGSSLPAQLRAPLDSLAVLRIQRPATLRLSFISPDTLVALEQLFTVHARMINLGTASFDSGRVRLLPPAGYQIRSDGDSFTSDPVERDFFYAGTEPIDFVFTLKAPDIQSLDDTLRVRLSGVPKDLNSGALAVVDQSEDVLLVSTLSTTLRIDSTVVISPAGAKDGVLSTRQLFTIRSYFHASETMRNVNARLDLPPGLGYELRTPQTVSLTAEDREVEWTLRAPEERIGNRHVFQIGVEGLDLDDQVSVKDSLALTEVQRRASLLLEKLTVASPPGLVQEGVAFFSVGQEAKLRTRVINEGQAGVEGTVRVGIDFLNSGFRLKNTSELPIKELGVDEVFEWTVLAPDSSTALREIRVAILQVPVDENTGSPAEIVQSPNELAVQTQSLGELTVEQIFISSPAGARDSTLSTGQTFVIGAEVSSDPQKIREGITATIHFSSDEFIAAVRNVNVPVGLNQIVTWAVTAPQTARLNADQVWVTVVGYDKRSNRQMTAQSESLPLRTEPRTVFSLQPVIVYPAGLIDFVSTEQEFHLSAVMTHEGADYNRNDKFRVALAKPADFQFKGGETFLKSDTRDTLTWRLQAPGAKPNGLSEFTFEIQNVPGDLNTGQEAQVRNRTVTFRLQTVAKTRLALRAYVDEEKNVIGTVRIGSSFDLQAELENLGEADFFGTFGARLILGSSRFQTTEPLQKSVTGGVLTWRINAPVDIVGPDTIAVVLTQTPRDQYSQQTATVVQDTARVVVSTESGMLLISQLSGGSGSVAVKGQDDRLLLGLELQNQDIGSTTRTLLSGFRLTFRNKRGEPIPASSMVERIAIVERGRPQTILGETSTIGDTRYVLVNFTHPDTIRGLRKREIDILADIPAQASGSEFSASIDSAAHLFAIDALSGYPVLIGDREGNRIDYIGMNSGVSVIVDPDLQSTFFNYPNPFGSSSRPNTRIVYALNEPSDVEIKIFTMTGELVKSFYFSRESDFSQTRAGLHENDVYWDGSNDKGMRVMNGVYLAYIHAVDAGITAKTKIAVVK
ncbi:hypothetical protein JW992_08920, partial [candidate division KSB1 bacterium]|nr:hypothetical protein [candidate division KSB1 bacterium]